ncbi:hypothetical protein AAEX28_03660 [Lentisphaerota bacterium WC36G]|nr:hypothetical protein LJT99_06535 [Lentisphaerae bacterium WC36]
MNLDDKNDKRIALLVKINGQDNLDDNLFLEDKLVKLTNETQAEAGLFIYDSYKILNKSDDINFDFAVHEIWDCNESYAKHINNKHTADFLALQYKNIITNIEFSIWDIMIDYNLKNRKKNECKILLECIINSDYSTIFGDSLSFFIDNLTNEKSCLNYGCFKKDINKKQNDDYRFCMIVGFEDIQSQEMIQSQDYFSNFINIINLITQKSLIESKMVAIT